jgi:hypothetical protein
MKAYPLALMAAIIAVPAAAQQGGLQAQSPTPGVGDTHVPAANLGMDSFSGPVVRGDHATSTSMLEAYTRQSRIEAQLWAKRASQGPIPETFAPQIRERLRSDLDAWRDEYSIRASDYRTMVAHWLVDSDKLTAAQWAQQRAAWFNARDAWVAAQGGKR